MAKIIWVGGQAFRAPQLAWDPGQAIAEEEVLAVMPAGELETLLREQPGLERTQEDEEATEAEAEAEATENNLEEKPGRRRGRERPKTS